MKYILPLITLLLFANSIVLAENSNNVISESPVLKNTVEKDTTINTTATPQKDSITENKRTNSISNLFNRNKNKNTAIQDSLIYERKRSSGLQDSLNAFKEKYYIIQDSISIERVKTDSLRNYIRIHEIVEENEIALTYQKKIAQIDLIVLKLANSRLYQRYNKQFHSEVIEYLNSVVTDSIKKDVRYEELLSLTKRYERDFNDILSILKEAQNDAYRTNPFSAEYADTYKNKLKQTRYYIEIYNASWKIPYLNNLLEEVFKRLESHNIEKKIFANFSDLIK